jgi:ATP adenylyltransferase/5',5'''-P-1,P-4-tetraphosphate phosphorylase II
LLISNQFHPQIGFINKKEFALWLWIILKIKGIGFYNSNKIAGASQPHKHLQIIPKDSVSKLYKEASSSAQVRRFSLVDLKLMLIPSSVFSIIVNSLGSNRPSENPIW